MRHLVEKLFKVKPEESSRVAAMFLLYLGIISVGFVVGRTVANSLFLQRLDRAFLPYTYAALAVVISLASSGYARLSRRFRREQLFGATIAIFAFGLLLLRGLLVIWPDSLAVVGSLYIFIDVMSILSITQFWTLAGDIFTTREAKRVFSVIGGGSAVGMLLFGALVRGVVHWVGTANLIFIMVAELAGCLAVLLWLRRSARDKLDDVHREGQEKRQSETSAGVGGQGFLGDLARLFRTRHLAIIGLVTAAMAFVITVIDYQWKMSARETYLGDEDGLTGYFSLYNLFVGLASFFVQFFLTGRILERLGIMAALMMLPGALAVASGAILLASAQAVALWAATAAAGANALLRFTVQNTSVQLFFRPLAADFRPRAQAVVEGVIKPVATGITGLFIAIAATRVTVRDLTWPVLAMVLVWIYLNLVARRQYVAALATRIRNRRLDLEGSTLQPDEETIRVIQETLRGSDAGAVRNALELLRSIPERRWGDDIVHLLASPSPDLRVEALRYLGELGEAPHAAPVRATLSDSDPAVRMAAVAALGSLLGPECRTDVMPLLADPDARVSAATAAAIVRHCPDAEQTEARSHLKELAVDPAAATREAAARALGQARGAAEIDLLAALINDGEPAVRSAAAEAAALTSSPQLASLLVDQLADPRVVRAATDSLVKMRELSLGILVDRLRTPTGSPFVRQRIPRVLSAIDDPLCVSLLLDSMGAETPGLRAEIAAAAGRLARRTGTGPDKSELLNGLAIREVKEFFKIAIVQAELQATPATLIFDALELTKRHCLKSLIELLAILHPGPDFLAIYRALDGTAGANRSDALELLDNTLVSPERTAILAAFELQGVEAQAEFARRLWPARPVSSQERLHELLASRDGWVKVAAVQFVGSAGVVKLERELLAVLERDNGFVAQTALGALRALLPPDRCESLARRFAGDGRQLLAEYASALVRREKMLTVVEKVLFLKSVDIFRSIPGPVLSRVAEIAREQQLDEGVEIIRQGDRGKGLYVVVKGVARLTVDGVEVAQLGEREFFGEMSLFDAEPTSATVTALTDIDLLKVEPSDFSDLMAERVEISHGLISVLIRRLRAATIRKSEQSRT